VVEKLRAGQFLTALDKAVNQQGLASVVLRLHQPLAAAVAEADAWPDALPAAELLMRLVRLHHERAREEQAGHARYLRPAYQAPDQQQAALALPTQAAVVTAATTGNRHWPANLAYRTGAADAGLARRAAASGPAAEQRLGSGWLSARAGRERGAAAGDPGRAQLGAADG
jgi:hypothetical protein